MSSNKRKLIFGAWVTGLALVLLTTAAYAWMTIATSLKVSDLELNVITENGMELAPDNGGSPGDWTTVLSLGELLDPETALRPVTWSAERDSFMAPQYGLDGRVGAVEPVVINSTQFGDRLSSPPEAEGDGESGHLIALDLWLRTGSSEASVCLSAPVETSPGVMGAGTFVIGEPVWNAVTVQHDNGGLGAERAIRVAFRSYDEEYDSGSVVIYEPNVSGADDVTESIDGGPLQGLGKLIRQAASTWTEQTPVLHGSVNYQMGEFLDEDTTLFKLQTDTPRRFTLYIWLEGQDEGCVNSISDAKLLANIQFAAVTGDERENIYRPTGG